MPRSRQRGRRNTHRRRLLEAERRFGPDQSEIVFTFLDGWTIRRIDRVADLKREGELMGHCLRSMVPPINDEDPQVFSLRDVDGYPHVTVFYDQRTGCAADFSGHGNAHPIKPDYVQYLL